MHKSLEKEGKNGNEDRFRTSTVASRSLAHDNVALAVMDHDPHSDFRPFDHVRLDWYLCDCYFLQFLKL